MLEWVAWFNTTRLLEPLGYLPPAESEAQYCAARADFTGPASNNQVSGKPGAIQYCEDFQRSHAGCRDR